MHYSTGFFNRFRLLLVMAVLRQAYPFWAYTVEKQKTGELEEVASALSLVLARSTEPSAFCSKYGQNEAKLKAFVESLDFMAVGKPLPPKEIYDLSEKLSRVLSFPEAKEIASMAVSKVNGYAVIQPLLEDDGVEEISFNGVSPVFVYYRDKGLAKTNLSFTKKDLDIFLEQLEIKPESQIVETRLAEGSRASVVLPPLVPLPSVTIRRFRAQPFSIVDLVDGGVLTAESASFLWTVVDGLRVKPLNALVVGGTATGKTTLLNSFASFIPPSERVVSIEDVSEVNLSWRENCVQMVASPEFDMAGLLKSALRMRPDRILLGDMRGAEVSSLFTAMNTGHEGVMGTMHANNASDAVARLQNEPMNVPVSLIPLLDVIVVMERFRGERGFTRRVVQISEVTQVEEGVIALNDLFLFDRSAGSLARSQFQSSSVEKLSHACGKSINEIRAEIDSRTETLGMLSSKGVRAHSDVNVFFSKYYEQFV